MSLCGGWIFRTFLARFFISVILACKDLRLTYKDVDRLTITPGRPPPILVNETYAACGTAAARVTPYLAVPDPQAMVDPLFL